MTFPTVRELWEYAQEQMNRSLGHMIKIAPLHVVLTVPAIWPDYARETMRQAAHNAGIYANNAAGKTVVSFVTEPEAAAIATVASKLPELGKIRSSDCVIVLDIGGKTSRSRHP